MLKNNHDKLIVALDVPSFEEAKSLVKIIGDEICFYKVGLELMMSGHYFELISWLKNENKKVFADLKLYDISETVARAVKNLSTHQIDFLTIHTASREIMSRAAENKGQMKIFGVTVLTNLDQKDLSEMGFDSRIPLEELVEKKTSLALESGLDGVVASAIEAKNLREKFGQKFEIITPGIRLEKVTNDDQKRVTDVKTAIENGASYLVVGRPITKASDPRAEANKFAQLISATHSTLVTPHLLRGPENI